MRILIILTFIFMAIFGHGQQSLLTFYYTSIELAAKRTKDVQRIPFKLSVPLDADKLILKDGRPVYVRMDKKFDKQYQDAVTAKIIKDSANFLEITIDLTMLRNAGTYEALFTFEVPGKLPQDVILSLVRPAAKLEPHPVIRIEMIGDAVTSADPIVLRESGRQSSIYKLTQARPFFAGVNNNDLVKLLLDTVKVEAASSFKINYNLDTPGIHSLPLGETTGKLEVMAPELAAPLAIDFKIIRKVARIWIIVMLFLGTMVGAFVRHFLKNRRELEARRVEGAELLEKMKLETKHIDDATFINDINTLTTRLQDAISKKQSWLEFLNGDLAELTKAINDTLSAFNSKMTTFEGERIVVADDMKLLSPFFGENNLLTFIKNSLLGSKDLYDRAVADLAKLNLESTKSLITLLTSKVDAVLNKLPVSIRTFRDAINLDPETETLLPVQITSNQKTSLRAINQGIEADVVLVKSSDGNAGAFVMSVKAVNAALQKVQHIVDNANRFMEAAVNSVYKPGTTEMENYKAAYLAWKSKLEDFTREPINLPDNSSVKILNDAYNVVAARIADFKAGPSEELSGTSFIPTSFLGAGGAIPVANLARTQVSLSGVRSRLLLFIIIQSLFIFALMALAAYRFYAPGFYGTTEEMIGLFLFAFGLDITVDNVYAIRDKR